MAIDKIFPWASLLIRFQYTCNRKFGINEVNEKLNQRVFLRGSLVPSHDRYHCDTLFFSTFWYIQVEDSRFSWGHMSLLQWCHGLTPTANSAPHTSSLTPPQWDGEKN